MTGAAAARIVPARISTASCAKPIVPEKGYALGNLCLLGKPLRFPTRGARLDASARRRARIRRGVRTVGDAPRHVQRLAVFRRRPPDAQPRQPRDRARRRARVLRQDAARHTIAAARRVVYGATAVSRIRGSVRSRQENFARQSAIGLIRCTGCGVDSVTHATRANGGDVMHKTLMTTAAALLRRRSRRATPVKQSAHSHSQRRACSAATRSVTHAAAGHDDDDAHRHAVILDEWYNATGTICSTVDPVAAARSASRPASTMPPMISPTRRRSPRCARCPSDRLGG